MVKKLIFTLLLVLLLVFSLVSALPRILGFKTFAVLSGSMEPAIHTGSLAYVKISDPEEILQGDIITYNTRDRTNLITHRVVSVNKTEKIVITKGDANENSDGLVEFNRILGKVIYSIPKLGYLTVYIKTKEGFLFSVGTLIIMILLMLFTEIFKRESKRVD